MKNQTYSPKRRSFRLTTSGIFLGIYYFFDRKPLGFGWNLLYFGLFLLGLWPPFRRPSRGGPSFGYLLFLWGVLPQGLGVTCGLFG